MRTLTFVLELPWDLGVPDRHTVPVFAPDNGGPSVAAYDAPAGLRATVRGDRRCSGWLSHRTTRVTVQRPLAASDSAFGDCDADASRSRARRALRALVARAIMARPFRTRRTVIAATVIVEEGEHHAPTVGFARALAGVNDWIVGLGVTHDDRIRPIGLCDIPPVVPMMAGVLQDRQVRHERSTSFVVADAPTDVRTYDAVELAAAEAMLAELTSGTDLAVFYELVQRAGSARRTSGDREAVIDYATAGEVFITAVLRWVGQIKGMTDIKLENLIAGSFKDRVLHFSRALGFPDDPADGDSPVRPWWLHCYLQRNRIVHEGANSAPHLSELARIGLVSMVVDSREALRADPDLQHLARSIRWAYLIDETGAGKDSWPDPL